MPAAAPNCQAPHFDRVENALVTAEGYRRLAALTSHPEHQRRLLRHAATWARRARRFEQQELDLGLGTRRLPAGNPCVALYGPGPQRARCAGCTLLTSHTPGNRTFHKCELRTFSRSARTDHRLRWAACARFQPRTAP